MRNRNRYYSLDENGQPVPVEYGTWLRTFPSMEQRTVAKTTVAGQDVSTVFLGVNHRHFGDGAPLLFETMVFAGPHDQDGWRWSTREDAQAGHDAVVAALREGRDPNEAVSQ